jgi:hypothetical protein
MVAPLAFGKAPAVPVQPFQVQSIWTEVPVPRRVHPPVLRAQVLVFPEELVAGGAAGGAVGDGVREALGVWGGSLAAAAGLRSLLGEGAAAATEDGGVADPGKDR